jgi:UDP-2,3-diacylglucosamine hydrolase
MPASLRTPCLIISDAHLGAAPAEAERTLVDFFGGAARQARSVVINGDLFDFWFEWKHVMPRAGFRALAAIAAARDAGTEIVWIAGNHDCWGGDVLRDAGASYHVGPWRGEIGFCRTVIEHGDGLREVEDAPYRRLRSVLRNPLAIWAFRHLLHPDWASALARRTSHTSRNMRPRDGGEGLRAVAQSKLAADPQLDLYVFGHTHAHALERQPNGGVYANPGAWMDAPRFLRIDAGAVALMELSGSSAREVQRSELRPR